MNTEARSASKRTTDNPKPRNRELVLLASALSGMHRTTFYRVLAGSIRPSLKVLTAITEARARLKKTKQRLRMQRLRAQRRADTGGGAA